MNISKSKHWMVIALGLLGASTNALACVVTPDSILTEGQTLQLVADCSGGTNGALGAVLVKTINWKMATSESGGATSITGEITLNQASPKKIYYTIPAELTSSGAGEYWFSVTGKSVGNATEVDDLGTDDKAKVVIKSANAVLSLANTVNPPVIGLCGSSQGAAVQIMPKGLEQCDPGKPALAISGPQSFTWSCLGVNGGAEANCYALRGYTVSATVGNNGSLVGISPVGGGVAAGDSATITVLPVTTNYSPSFSSPCGGIPSGNSFTTGPVNSNCNVTVSFNDTPVYGACGSANNVTPIEAAPSTGLCTLTGGTPTSVVDTAVANKWTWGCNGTPNGSSTSATACQAPKGYMVTTAAGSNGSIAAGKVVAGGTNTSFTVSPTTPGYAISTVSGCGGSLYGNTYTTGTITAACTVTASFAVQTALTTDPGIGAGLWVPPNMPTRTVADQSGDANWKISYVPGCLNGLTAPNSSSGCSAQTSYTGTIAGATTSRTVTMGSGNQLVLRYKSTPTAGSSVKYIRTRAFDGGNVGMNMRVWLSTDPSATYANVTTACKQTSSRTPMVIMGPGYCPIAPNTVYYYGIEYDETSALRFTVEETASDFL
jgi:hypothetical protein